MGTDAVALPDRRAGALAGPVAAERRVWYLAQCKSGQEHLAAERLVRRNLAAVFLPREARNRRWRGRFQSLLVPVFPGYLFLAPSADRADWPAIRATRGLTRMVSFDTGQSPAAVPAQAVAALAARCDGAGVLQPPEDLRPGEAVRITGGAFADLVATIARIEPDARLCLLLDLMGRQVPVAMERALLRRSA